MGEEGRETMNTQMLKQSIRQRILSEREQLSLALRAQHSTEIVRRIVQMPEYKSARTVLGYMSFGAEFKSEIWVLQALADGKRLALPKVNHYTDQLDLYWADDLESHLAAGLWGIREPIVERCERLDMLNEIEFVLLPGVAFGRDGARLGYGGGFYDKLLVYMRHNPTLVAGAYSIQIVEGIPQEATDRKVQWLVTENETLHCAA